MSNYIPYRFEDLPNEIFLEIFGYMKLHDLIRSFYNLNIRFNTILFSSNIHLHILYPDDLEENNLDQKFLANFILNQRFISRLRLSSEKNLFNQKFINFSHIRSLILDTPTSSLIELITSKTFPRLEYLRIGYLSNKTQLSKFHQNIFSNQFPYLSKCSLDNLNDQEQWTGSPAIYSLGIWSDNPHTIVHRVLVALINLRSLHLFLTWKVTHQNLDKQIIFQHSNLKILKLHLNGLWTLEKLDSFFAYIPTVKILSLYSSYFDSHMISFSWDFRQLAFIFLSRLPYLSYFDCEFIFQKDKLCDITDISSLHSCFNRIKYEIYSESDLLFEFLLNKIF